MNLVRTYYVYKVDREDQKHFELEKKLRNKIFGSCLGFDFCHHNKCSLFVFEYPCSTSRVREGP